MIPAFLLLALVPSVSSLVSDDFAMHALMTHSRRVRRDIALSPEDHPLRALTTVTGSVTATSCSSNTCTSAGAGSYCTHSLTYSTTTGIFTGSMTTNNCPSHASAYKYNGVEDASVAATASKMASCQTYSVPQSTYTSTSALKIPLRSGLGLTVTGEIIYAAMDAGFTVGQACTESRGMCPAGSDAYMCNAIFDKWCGTKYLMGNSSSTMHMFLSDCGGHAGYHDHYGLSCEYSTTATGHSTLVGIMLDGRGMYGMYEETGTKPTNLDACNGHTGNVPATTVITYQGTLTTTTSYTYAAATSVYHYHVTPTAPYFLGCFGPVASLAAAKALYTYCSPTKYCSCDQATGYCNCNGVSMLGTAVSSGASSGGTAYYYSECTAFGYYSNYALDCPIYSHCTASTSSNTGTATCDTNNQYVTTNTSCVPCFGNCAYSSSTTTTTTTTTATTATTTSSNDLAIGLGVGLGVGIPVVALGILLYLGIIKVPGMAPKAGSKVASSSTTPDASKASEPAAKEAPAPATNAAPAPAAEAAV